MIEALEEEVTKYERIHYKNTAEAATIVLVKMRHGLLEYRRNIKRLRETIGPLLGFRWDRSLLCAVGAEKFNDSLSIVKSSDLPLEEIDKLRKLFLGAFSDPSLIFPDFGEIWRCRIAKFHLFEIWPFAQWLKVATALNKAHIEAPSDLASLIFAECAALDEVNATNGDIILLWQTALWWRATTLRNGPFFPF